MVRYKYSDMGFDIDMGEKDITEKILLSYADVFADIVNALLFKGKQVIRPQELVDQAPRAIYKADGKTREVERDVAKRWLKNNIRIACIGFENETKPDPDMPLRVFNYDGSEYRIQLLKENKSNLKHVEAVLQLLSVMTNDTRFEEILNLENGSAQGGVHNMCDVLDRAEARGEKKGEIKFAALITKLIAVGRDSEVEKVASDEKYRAKLFQEFKIL